MSDPINPAELGPELQEGDLPDREAAAKAGADPAEDPQTGTPREAGLAGPEDPEGPSG